MIAETKNEALTAEQYHADPRMSNSKLKLFRENRRKFYRTYIARDLAPDAPTASKMLGTYLHMAILEPEKWQNRATPKPEYQFPELASDGKKFYKRKGSDHEREWNEHLQREAELIAAWERENEGKICPNEKQIATVENMIDALTHHIEARRFLELPAEHERTIYWECAGVPMKSRLDKDLPRLILDLKTTQDASPTAFYFHDLKRFSYHCQEDNYCRAKKFLDGEDPDFLFIVVESDEPHRVGVYDVGQDEREEAAWMNARALEDYRACLQSGDWREDWEKSVMTLSRPERAMWS